jgi:23S rRNA (uracil1939-C5)-methyltransferase
MKTVTIEKLVFGGCGLGRDGGGVVLIPGALPDETVEYEDDGLKGGTRVGRVRKVLEKSPHRRDAPCPHAGDCGGCDWLHFSYDEQVRQKKEIFLDCVDRIGKFHRPNDIEAFTAAEFGYRMRAQIKIDRERNCAGFFRRKTNDVVRVDRCPLLVDEINGVLTELNSGAVRGIGEDVKSVRVLAGNDTASSPVIGGLTRAGTEIDVAEIKFLADGGSFFQSNKFLLETLGRWASGFVNNESVNDKSADDNAVNNISVDDNVVKNKSANSGFVNKKRCLDLYGGIGFFSLMLAGDFAGVTLVENVKAQVEDARRNFEANGKNHLKAVLADVEKDGCLDRLAKEVRPDCVIVDPPRPGLVKSVRKWLTDAAPPVVLYVSCNPSTFARDAGALVNGGYKLSRWALFDLYPNTHHIESAALFNR